MTNANGLSGEVPSLVEDGLAVLRAVFDTIPTFWGTSEIASVFRLHFDSLALGSSDEIGSLARRVASKAPTAVLLSTYFETWPSVSSAQAGVSSGGFPQPPVHMLRVPLRRNTWLVTSSCSGGAFAPRLGHLCLSIFDLCPKCSLRDSTYGINVKM
jgi:hypothetical protein